MPRGNSKIISKSSERMDTINGQIIKLTAVDMSKYTIVLLLVVGYLAVVVQ